MKGLWYVFDINGENKAYVYPVLPNIQESGRLFAVHHAHQHILPNSSISIISSITSINLKTLCKIYNHLIKKKKMFHL